MEKHEKEKLKALEDINCNLSKIIIEVEEIKKILSKEKFKRKGILPKYLKIF